MPDTPRRIQRQRARGWRMPDNTVYVGRPTRWGNPFIVGHKITVWLKEPATQATRIQLLITSRAQATDLFRKVLTTRDECWFDNWGFEHGWEAKLAGKNLACWCPLDQPCHATVLLHIANETPLSADRTTPPADSGTTRSTP